jgi:hypothetical protein
LGEIEFVGVSVNRVRTLWSPSGVNVINNGDGVSIVGGGCVFVAVGRFVFVSVGVNVGGIVAVDVAVGVTVGVAVGAGSSTEQPDRVTMSIVRIMGNIILIYIIVNKYSHWIIGF